MGRRYKGEMIGKACNTLCFVSSSSWLCGGNEGGRGYGLGRLGVARDALIIAALPFNYREKRAREDALKKRRKTGKEEKNDNDNEKERVQRNKRKGEKKRRPREKNKRREEASEKLKGLVQGDF